MLSEIKNILKGKSILVLGFGKEGKSTAGHLRRWFPDMHYTVADKDADALKGMDDGNVSTISGAGHLAACSDFDLIIKSPGIPFESVAVHCDAAAITSQTDLFLRAYGKRVIGVTGTKGKSTTTTLIHHILLSTGKDALLAGNIGIPSLDLAEKIGPDSIVVFEMSSHQLEHISIAPHIAVILNVFPEHLDHYKDFTAYKMAKFNISLKQADGGSLVYNMDDPILAELVHEQAKEKNLLPFSFENPSARAYIENNLLKCFIDEGRVEEFPLEPGADLPGKHNGMNLMAAILVCLESGISPEAITSALKSYRRPEHRLEFVGKFSGISFYNDSIATIPEASIAALDTLGKVDLLILGGYDRQLDYGKLYRRLKEGKTPWIVFMGDAGKRMYREWVEISGNSERISLVDGMKQAFILIEKVLGEGDICLLSPAAASYGMFRNFEERGEVYKKMAAAL